MVAPVFTMTPAPRRAPVTTTAPARTWAPGPRRARGETEASGWTSSGLPPALAVVVHLDHAQDVSAPPHGAQAVEHDPGVGSGAQNQELRHGVFSNSWSVIGTEAKRRITLGVVFPSP